MIIKPTIRSNIFTNSHPLGCKQFVLNQINETKQLESFEGPKNVLIIGGSSGYGLSSRIALAFAANANTINISFESGPKGKRTGSAGYWNNVYFQEFAAETGNLHKDFVGDAFSNEMKANVLNYIKESVGKIDLVIYSLAAGARKNSETGEVVRSHIKAIGEPAIGKTIDIATLEVMDLTVQGASEQEIQDTVYVMGGSDWFDWVSKLDENGLLEEGCKTISYTYIGGPTTEKIYRGGSMGQAKEDLEEKAFKMNELLSSKYKGEALISSSKAVATKASVFIPQMTIYVSCLYDVMTRNNVHESILEHKYRLFKDMVYGDGRILDEKGRVRLDHLEMDDAIQEETVNLMNSLSDDEVLEFSGTKMFLEEFYKINGFRFDEVDYDADVDIKALGEKELK